MGLLGFLRHLRVHYGTLFPLLFYFSFKYLAIANSVKQYLLAAGLAAEKSSRATNMVYVQMLFALIGDKLIFNTNPSLLSLLGSSLILSSAIYVALQKGSIQINEKNRGEGPGSVNVDEEQGLTGNLEEEAEIICLPSVGGTEANNVRLQTLRK